MRKPLIAGNWKMNLNHLEAIAVTQKLSYSLDDKDFDAVDVVVIPPFTDIRSVQTLDRWRSTPPLPTAHRISRQKQVVHSPAISVVLCLNKLGCSYVASRSLRAPSDS
jgi:triosephosphate isomerase (TIM)